MKRATALFITSCCILSMHAQTAAVASNTGSSINKSVATVPTQPVSKEVLGMNETEYDFGKIPQGKPTTHVFVVVNNGADSLRILKVQASCGCTTPDWEKNKVQAPGEKTNITVGYNAAAEGVFTKTITITYNDSETKQIVIKGEVWKTPSTSAPENKELVSLQEQ